MRVCALLELMVGSTLLGPTAWAQEKIFEAIPFTGEVRMAAPESLVGGTPGLAIRAFGPRGTAGAVYDNITSTGDYFMLSYTNTPHFGDDISLAPGNQSAIQPQLLTGMDVVLSVQDSQGVGRSFDVAVSFWDTLGPGVGPVGQAYSDPLGGLRGSFSLPGGTWIVPLDLSGLPGGGIQLADGGFYADIAFYEVGTSTYLSSNNSVTCMFRSPSNYGTVGMPAGMNGFSMPWFFNDINGDGQCGSGERVTVYPFTLLGNLAYTFYGDVRCSADFNNDGFVDPLDYNQFIDVFEAGGCP